LQPWVVEQRRHKFTVIMEDLLSHAPNRSLPEVAAFLGMA
jgi:hypothetical protein